jgi:hypothetical protein
MRAVKLDFASITQMIYRAVDSVVIPALTFVLFDSPLLFNYLLFCLSPLVTTGLQVLVLSSSWLSSCLSLSSSSPPPLSSSSSCSRFSSTTVLSSSFLTCCSGSFVVSSPSFLESDLIGFSDLIVAPSSRLMVLADRFSTVSNSTLVSDEAAVVLSDVSSTLSGQISLSTGSPKCLDFQSSCEPMLSLLHGWILMKMGSLVVACAKGVVLLPTN